mmetsp:Transcript_34087/g.71752  ORF Transcript_34087/g.71752 Transcript_34087/m.71752 type:complete len:301 (-) Transcript_34087:62-964(-)
MKYLLVILFKLGNLGILLSLNISLPLLNSLLSLTLEALVRREVLLLTGRRILADLLVDSLVKLLQAISLNVFLKVAGELGLVLGVILLFEVLHVLTDVSTKDALTVHISIVLLRITVVSRETLLGMRNVKSTISGTLQGTENTASSGGGLASNIQQGPKGTLVLIHLIHIVGSLTNGSGDNVAVHLIIALINIIQSNLLEQTTSAQKSGAVSGGVVLKSNTQSISGQLVRAGRGKDAISINETVGNLADDLTVGETHDETVLGRLVLILCLAAETLALTVVGLTLTATTVLDLVPLVVRF